MFEQELQNQENGVPNTPIAPNPVSQSSAEPELFNHYEIRNWNFTPALYKIFAGSAILNIVALLVVGQSHLLTQKGCESPLVSSVCQVIDTVYVGSRLMTGNNEFSVTDYNKTKIDDAGDINYVEVPEVTEPLDYPDGYFALANPQEFVTDVSAIDPISGLPSDPPFTWPPTGPISTSPNNFGGLPPQVLPTPNPNAVIGNVPLNPFGNSGAYKPPRLPRPAPSRSRNSGSPMDNGSPKLPKIPGDETASTAKPPAKPSPTPTPTPVDPATAAAQATDTAKKINKKPFLDLGDTVLNEVSAKTLDVSDLTKPFTVSVNATLNEDGSFDKTKTRFDDKKDTGDPKMVSLAKSAIEAIGDSKVLMYLKNLNVDKVNLTLVQDDNQIYAVITSDQPSKERADSIASGLKGLIAIGKIGLSGSTSQGDLDTIALFKDASATSKGKNFTLTFKVDKPIAQAMITRQLQNAQAKRQQPQQPNSTIETKPVQNAGK